MRSSTKNNFGKHAGSDRWARCRSRARNELRQGATSALSVAGQYLRLKTSSGPVIGRHLLRSSGLDFHDAPREGDRGTGSRGRAVAIGPNTKESRSWT